MNRHLLHAPLAAALLGALVLAGCRQQQTDDAATPPAATEPATPAPAPTAPEPTPTPAPAAVTVTAVDLGSAIGPDNRITTPTAAFAKGDTIHASVATDGGAAANVAVKWTYGEGEAMQTVSTEQKSVPAGAQVTEFRISKPDGWPAGKYKLEVSLDGNVVQTREFEVK